MTTYLMSFRIADKTVNGMTYNDRRQGMIDAVHTKGLGIWDGTTSFILVESMLDTQTITNRASASLSRNDDMLVVVSDDMSMRHFGKIEHEDVLKSFFWH